MAGPRAKLDVMGYPKEGRAEGDLAGAASIIIPADTYLAGAQESAARETLVFFAFLACCLMVAFFGVSRLVTRPLRKLGVASGKLERHEFDVDVRDVGQGDEVEDLARCFDSMARELKALYEHLESEVEVRTSQIVESNRELERQRLELESMNRILQQDNLLKEDFLAKMSHEIRTPLTSILAFVDLWEQTNTPRDEGEGKIMSEMKLSSQILLSMVNNILDLTRVEAGHAEVVMGPVDAADLLGIGQGRHHVSGRKEAGHGRGLGGQGRPRRPVRRGKASPRRGEPRFERREVHRRGRARAVEGLLRLHGEGALPRGFRRRVRHRAGRPAARVQPLRPGKPAGRRRRPLLRQQRAGACPWSRTWSNCWAALFP